MPIIKRGVREGLTHARIEAALRKEGLGIRHEVMRSFIRAERAVVAYGKQLQYLRPSQKPIAQMLPESMKKLSRRYLFTLEVETRTLDEGLKGTRFLSISIDKLLSRAEFERMARDVIESHRSRYGMEVTSVLLMEGEKEGEQGTL